MQRQSGLTVFVLARGCCCGRTFVTDEGQQALGLRNTTDSEGLRPTKFVMYENTADSGAIGKLLYDCYHR